MTGRTRRLTAFMTLCAVKESRPLVGSSRKSTAGSLISAMPMLVRFACPPLMPRDSTSPMWVSAHFCSVGTAQQSERPPSAKRYHGTECT